MNILVVGGAGFLGRHVAHACRLNGHQVVNAVRKSSGNGGSEDQVLCDLRTDTGVDLWRDRVQRADGVINCAGLLHGTPDALHAVHCLAPAAMAAACARENKPFLHISILGLEQARDTPYFASRRHGDAQIREANPAAIIVRPSVVFGADSPASRVMLLQARLPAITLPRDTQPVMPVHVDDLAELCATLIATLRALGADVDCVGSEKLSIAQYIRTLRESFATRAQADAQRVIHLPNALMRLGLDMSGALGAAMLRSEILDLMEHPHIGRPQDFVRWMHRQPRPVSAFVRREGSLRLSHLKEG
jgi:uncharacterized protein YbjT (DUF2867 family)